MVNFVDGKDISDSQVELHCVNDKRLLACNDL